MRIPFGDINITRKSKTLIAKILDSNRVTCGKYVREFEERFAALIGTREAVAVSSGTDAVALSLAGLYDSGVKRGDEVVLPALSFVATGNAVLQAGLKPVFVDIERSTLNIDPDRIERALTKKTRVILPVHLMGKPAEMETIQNIARRHKLFIVEDAAEAYGAVYKDRPVGTLGNPAAFSLYAAHMVTTVEGGMVTTDNAKLAQVLRSLRSHGRACKCRSCSININSEYCRKRFKYGRNRDIRFIFERIGFSSKMNELEAAVGLGNLERYPRILSQRRKNLLYLMDKFRRFSPYLSIIEEGPGERIGPHAFAVIVNEKSGFSRDELVFFLEKHGIETRSLFSSMPTQCPGFKFLGYKAGEFPAAEYIGENGFHISINQGLRKKHLDYILQITADFLISNAGGKKQLKKQKRRNYGKS
jgi:dTDP-4-amino-4,6-dideoxygalactose transaminase